LDSPPAIYPANHHEATKVVLFVTLDEKGVVRMRVHDR